MDEKAPRKYLGDVSHELQDLIHDGNKIQAIKRIREDSHLGLKEALDKVNEIEARVRERFPGSIPERRRLGCGAGVLVLLALAAATLLFVSTR